MILDRDGTLVVERHYLSRPEQVELIPGTAAALGRLRRLGLGLVVVTNQSGIGRGLFDTATLGRIHARMCNLLEAEGAQVDGIYSCPHRPEDECSCRKPRTGLVDIAAVELGFDPQRAIVVGDQASDIALGQRLGATTLLVRTGYGAEVVAQNKVKADHVVSDLTEAVPVIECLLQE